MIKDFRINGARAPDAMHKAKVGMATGMGIVEKSSTTDKSASIVSVETIAGVFVVNKERAPSGIDCVRDDMSDYGNDLVKIKANEFTLMDKYYVGEKSGTDQYNNTTTSNLALNTRVP